MSVHFLIYHPTCSGCFWGWLHRRDLADCSCELHLDWIRISVRPEARVGALLLGIHQNHPVTKSLLYNTSSPERFIVLVYWDAVFCVDR